MCKTDKNKGVYKFRVGSHQIKPFSLYVFISKAALRKKSLQFEGILRKRRGKSSQKKQVIAVMDKTQVFLLLVNLIKFCASYHLGFFVPIFEEADFLGTREEFAGQSFAHALTIAIDDVNTNSTILPGHNLTYSWTNSKDNLNALRAMHERYISPAKNPVDVFIGPAHKCAAPARVAEAFHVPMISYFCSESAHFTKQDYPLFVQTYQNVNSQAYTTLLDLLKTMRWSRIGVISEEGDTYWENLAGLISRNIDINVVRWERVPKEGKFDKFGMRMNFENLYKERNNSLARVRRALLDMTKEMRIKIFVLLTSFPVVIEIMSQVDILGLNDLSQPRRAFIAFQLDQKKRRSDYFGETQMFYAPLAEPVKEVQFHATKAARSLLVISAGVPQSRLRYEHFRQELIRRTEHEPPFKDESIYDFNTGQVEIGGIACDLYDAVYQYALALDRLHKKNATITSESVLEEFRSHSYTGICGYTAIFSKNGLLKVHLSLLHVQDDVTRESFENVTAKTAGKFTYLENDNISLTLYNDQQPIKWPWGLKTPTDKLTCEDDNHACPQEGLKIQYIIPTGISAVFIVIFIVLMLLFFRQWKRERLLKRSVWQIDINEVLFDRKVSTDSKCSNDSGIRASMLDLEASTLLDFPESKDLFSNPSAIKEDEICDFISMKSFSAMRSVSGTYMADRVFVKILPKNVDITKPMQKELRMLRHIHHENLNPFIGLGCESNYLWIVMQLGSKGTLEEVLANSDITLDHRFVLSLVYDIAKGMSFLHNSEIKSHGNLKSSNCIIDNRWVLKITDYGIPTIRSRQLRYMGPNNEEKKFRELLWKAPELLRDTDPPLFGTRKGDVYSFAIILEELHTLKPPYSNSGIPARDIVERVVDGEVPPYRPVVAQPIENAQRLLPLMKECWRENPDKRPAFNEIKYDVESAMNRCGLKTDICDNMITLLENYSNDLENVVSQRTRQLRDEKHKTDALLDRMLPRSVAEQLKKGNMVQAESFESVTIYFSDIVQFTALCAESTPMEVVDMLNDLYLLFDDIITDYSVYKVETIGDAYMVVSGLPRTNGKLHASEISCMALEILDSVKKFKVGHKPKHELQIRIGIHSGPVVAGVVGMTMPRYCLFGDTVNTASRMESNGKELQIHVSGSTKEILDELGGFHLVKREEEVYLKGKGQCTTYWLRGASSDVPRCPRKLSEKAMKPLFQNVNSRKFSQPYRTRKKTQISFPRASVA
ncbi:speract receptor-like isoform X3 [Xenia sp. Carnegie-2017]|uniref:speract receptor-like isoform X3 n=1 Tax=Xenia sp. Carnegie-2017 TaxID=2897299 RepID=UPI001F042643|nr:speract receptor-like isoform X3 [Xenia sp. Carnegie-2017]